jgi:hypothetical protein
MLWTPLLADQYVVILTPPPSPHSPPPLPLSRCVPGCRDEVSDDDDVLTSFRT